MVAALSEPRVPVLALGAEPLSCAPRMIGARAIRPSLCREILRAAPILRAQGPGAPILRARNSARES